MGTNSESRFSDKGRISADEYQASSGMATSCLYVMVCVQMQARSNRTIKSGSMVRRLSL
jgi:hypothetical protein